LSYELSRSPSDEADQPDEPVRAGNLGTRVRRFLLQSRSAAGIVFAVGVVWLIFFLLTDGVFLTDRNIINLMRQTSITAMVALGMLVVIAQGEIDLSVGSFLGLCATVIALLESRGAFPPGITIVAAIGLGALIGVWNGLWVAKLGIPAISGIRDQLRFFGEAFITGPALWVILAAAMILALLPLRRVLDPKHQRDALLVAALGLAAAALLAWTTLSYRGLPMPVALTLAAAAVLDWVLRNVVWGRHVYAIGGNRAAARIAGVPITRHIIGAYVLIGVLTALAAIMFVGRLGAAPPEAGYFLELNAISAVVIGGASLYGGRGTVPGVLLGALLMQSLSNGLSLMNVQSAYQNITSGLVLMFAVYLDAVSKRGGLPFVRQ
jgi:D-xylose transport system permease protein